MTPSYSNALQNVFFCLINNLTDDKRCLEIQLACLWSCCLIIPIMSRCFPALSTSRHTQQKIKASFILLFITDGVVVSENMISSMFSCDFWVWILKFIIKKSNSITKNSSALIYIAMWAISLRTWLYFWLFMRFRRVLMRKQKASPAHARCRFGLKSGNPQCFWGIKASWSAGDHKRELFWPLGKMKEHRRGSQQITPGHSARDKHHQYFSKQVLVGWVLLLHSFQPR